MTVLQRLLAATDCSGRAEYAEVRAAMLCEEHRCGLAELMMVREPGEPEVLARIMNSTAESAMALVTDRATAALKLRAAFLQDNHGVGFACTVRFGRTAAEIVARAEEVEADLLVIGAHGGNFFSDLLLGNTADKLIHLCKRPVLVVKNLPQQPYRRVLVPVDFSEDSLRAAEVALRTAPQADVTFLHAFEVLFEGQMQFANVPRDIIDDYRVKAHDEARIRLNRFVDALDVKNRRVKRAVTFGIPGPVVREHAKATNPDLNVLGKHGRSRFAEMIIGSVTRDTIDQTSSDVLVVPGEGA